MSAGLAAACEPLVDADYLAASGVAEAWVDHRAGEVLAALGMWRRAPARPRPAAGWAADLGVAGDRLRTFRWLLEAAADAGRLAREPGADGPRYRPLAPPAEELPAELARGVEEQRDGLTGTVALVDFVTARYPAFLRGEVSGHGLLLRGEGARLWERYFSPATSLYHVHNRAALAAARLALAGLSDAVLLELGAGTGGATRTLVDGLDPAERRRLRRLVVSDLSPLLPLRILERLGQRDLPLERRRVDFRRPIAEQGVEPGEVDVMVAVNALHNSDDLPTTLRSLASSLSPDGALVISESLCGPGRRVHQDYLLGLLPFGPSPLPEGVGGAPRLSRFLTAGEWRAALAAAGLEAELWVNRRGPELALAALVGASAG